MKYIIITASISSIIFTGCNSHHHENADSQWTHQQVGEINELQLDNIEKWKVNSEMIPYVEASENLLLEYINQNSNKNYKTLAEGLSKNTNKLVSSCTMDSKSHEELHKWLYPHMQYIKDLSRAEKEKAEDIIKDLQLSFDNYHQYFN